MVWVSTKTLLGGLRVKLQQMVDAAAIEEAVFLAVGLISSLLDKASNHQRESAPCDVVTRADMHQAVRDMRVCLHRVLPRHRNTDPIWDSPLQGTTTATSL